MPQPPSTAPRIVIAGFGLLTPLGQGAWETFSALLAGRTIADRTAALPDGTDPVDLVRAVGAVRLAQHSAADPAIELAERAAREAAFMAGVETRGLSAILGAGKGAVGAMTQGAKRLSAGGGWKGDSRKEAGSAAPSTAGAASGHHPALAALALGPHGHLAHRARQRLGVRLVGHHVAACASGLTALHHARQHLLHRRHGPDASSCCLVLTSEAALTPLFVHSYRRLGVLAPPTPELYHQRPLDERRRGFMLSEMAAAVVLQRLPPGSRPAAGDLELIDTGVAAETGGLIRPTRPMAALARLAKNVLSPEVDVIHPHAPGTADHDPAELAAYREALAYNPRPPNAAGAEKTPPGQRRANDSNTTHVHDKPPMAPGTGRLPDLYAAKGAIGHGLGASGLASLVLACLCLTAGRRPPMPWLERPIASNGWPIADAGPSRACSRTGRHAVFASGFGGHVAGASVRRH